MKSKLFAVLAALVVLFIASPAAFAQGEAAAAGAGAGGMAAIGAGLAIGLSALGAALGQGRQGAAALEGIARNPQAAGKIQTPMIIALAFTEALALYGFVIGIMIVGKI
ncbi:MAG: ATP synthase F0 subunit C [Myxococcota bacterium]|jgi:F-type H+-transporting ATPase subunit c|nr:ATP synthase F0 subunit C [Myxococcota bacterium]